MNVAISNGWMDPMDPENSVTRYIVVNTLWKIDGCKTTATKASFSDVEAIYEAPVNWAASSGVVNGYDATHFGGTDNVTREQMATIICRYELGTINPEVDTAILNQFTDASSIANWAKAGMAWAVENGIFVGNGDGTINPLGNITIAELATVAGRIKPVTTPIPQQSEQLEQPQQYKVPETRTPTSVTIRPDYVSATSWVEYSERARISITLRNLLIEWGLPENMDNASGICADANLIIIGGSEMENEILVAPCNDGSVRISIMAYQGMVATEYEDVLYTYEEIYQWILNHNF